MMDALEKWKKTATRRVLMVSNSTKKDYEKFKNGEIPPFKIIPRSLKPNINIYTKEIEITTPDGRKEYYKEEQGILGSKYVKVR